MARINENFIKLPASYLFSEIAKKTAKFREENPGLSLIHMGIGDVTLPLPAASVEAMKRACDDLSDSKTFYGYGPEQGYPFLREKIADYDYHKRNIDISADEIFISDGAKSDCGNIGGLFDINNKVAVCDPVYPVYVDSNVMDGRGGELVSGRWSNIIYLPCDEKNNFVPSLPKEKADIIYLCFPNNPTGAVASKDDLKKWVDYALENNSVIIFDSAYEAFITDDEIPHSIYEIEGARKCAIEIRSFSKTAGFTGVRCGYTVVPKDLTVEGTALWGLWLRRQSTKFNGASYIVQRGAEAIYSVQGRKEVQDNINYYLNNAKIMANELKKAGIFFAGGENSPYIWLKDPKGTKSWELFDKLLKEANVITTPGSGFGACGEGFIRLTAFGSLENTEIGIKHIIDTLR